MLGKNKYIYICSILFIVFGCGLSKFKARKQAHQIVDIFLEDYQSKSKIDSTRSFLQLSLFPISFENVKTAKFVFYLRVMDKKDTYDLKYNQLYNYKGIDVVLKDSTGTNLKLNKFLDKAVMKNLNHGYPKLLDKKDSWSIFFNSQFEIVAIYAKDVEQIKIALESNGIKFAKEFKINPWG